MQSLKNKIKILGISLVIICLFLLFFGAFLKFWPIQYVQADQAHADPSSSNASVFDPNTVANWMSYLNFLLALIAFLATAIGLVFAWYQFYEANRLPKIVEKAITEELEKWTEKNDKKMKNLIKAYSLLLEQAIAKDAGKVQEVSRLSSLKEAEAAYKDLWGLKYFKALAYYYEDTNPAKRKKNRATAIKLLEEHLAENPDHTKAYVFLLFWRLKQGSAHRALSVLETLLERKPEYCYELQILQDENWGDQINLLKDRNRVLYLAERKVYEQKERLDEFLNPDHTTQLEKMLKHVHRGEDPSLYSREILLDLNETSQD